MLSDAKKRAKKKKLSYDLTLDWLLPRLLRGKCDATGVVIDFNARDGKGYKHIKTKSPSIDRINPTKGYTKDNSQLVCWKHNAAKAESTEKEHIDYCVIFLRYQGYKVKTSKKVT